MARVKSTARADARRRYRATQQAAEASPEEAETSAPGGDPALAGLRPPGGLRSLFKVSWPDWRADVAAFPDLLRTQRSLWLAIGAIVLGTVLCIGLPRAGQVEPGQILLQLLLYVPSIPLLLAGYFAPRAAWLEGGVLGALSLIGFLLAQIVGFGPVLGLSATPDKGQSLLVVAASLIVQWVILGAVFGALAAWYRRWLRTSNENARRTRDERDKRKRQEAKAQARTQARPR